MIAEAAMPAVPNQDCGRRASLCSSRAILTNSRTGWAASKPATSAGTLASNRSLTRHAPAFVEASWSAYFRLSKNVRCIGPASSSDASPLTCWPPRDGSTKRAFVNAAIAASVDEGGCSKNLGCAIPPVAVRLVTSSERCPAAKLELLNPVELTLGKRHRIVKAKRAERRRPDQTDTHGTAHGITAVEHQARTGPRCRRTDRRPDTIRIGRRGEFARGGPGSRSLIIKQPARVGINGALQSNFLRQEPERQLQLRRQAPILGASECVHRAERIDIARTDAVGGKATDQVRPHLEVGEHANLVVADLFQNAALSMDQSDNIGNQRGVVFRVNRTLQIGHVTADSGEVLLEVNQQTVGRVPVVVQRIVIQRIAERRGHRLAVLELLADRQRCLAVTETPEADTRSVCRTQSYRSGSSVRIHPGRRRIKGEQRRSRIVVAIGQIARQRDLLLVDRIPKLQGKVLAQSESKPRTEAQRLGAVRNITIRELLAIERVKAKRNTVVQQIGLDKRKREPARVLAIGQRRLGK